MKIDFISDEFFIIYYIGENEIKSEEELKYLFKILNNHLKKCYDYEFSGFYHVNIYVCGKLMIMEFENLDDFGRADFDITLILHSTLLYEFEDYDMFDNNKVYYNNKFYIDLEDLSDSVYLFEYGNIIYGDKVNKILNNGIFMKAS